MDTAIYGLLGRRLGHSYSVPVHRLFGTEYRLFEKEPEDLPAFLSDPRLGGLNVTIPYKQTVFGLLDEVSGAARDIGAVNTIVFQNGKKTGYNTDLDGFLFLLKYAGIRLEGKKVILLGSGGTSRTAREACRREGASSVTVISRSGQDNYESLSALHRDAQIIINTTPVGMYPANDECLIDLKDFPDCEGVIDVIYNPLRTRLVMQAESLGIPASGGLPMLIEQARKAEELFTGRTIPEEETLRVLEEMTASQENIILIGMPGSGKTTIGRELAQRTGRPFADTDLMIEQEAGMTIPEIFAAEGEEGFRLRESAVLAEAGRMSGAVLATGGGAVLKEENYPLLHQNGRIYHIERDLPQLASEGRPLSADRSRLAEMERVRAPYYRRFRDFAVKNDGSVNDAAEIILGDFLQRREELRKTGNTG